MGHREINHCSGRSCHVVKSEGKIFNYRMRAQPPLEFIPPELNSLVLQGCQALLPWWLKWKTNITEIETEEISTLIEMYQRFQEGKVRFLIAFRHPTVNDPYCLSYLLWNLVPKVALKQGKPLKLPIHAHFIYDRGIPIWAGSRMGGTLC